MCENYVELFYFVWANINTVIERDILHTRRGGIDDSNDEIEGRLFFFICFFLLFFSFCLFAFLVFDKSILVFPSSFNIHFIHAGLVRAYRCVSVVLLFNIYYLIK